MDESKPDTTKAAGDDAVTAAEMEHFNQKLAAADEIADRHNAVHLDLQKVMRVLIEDSVRLEARIGAVERILTGRSQTPIN